MQKKPRTFRSVVLIVVVITVVVTAAAIQFFAQRETKQAMLAAHDENALNLLNTVVLNVENQYQSIRFHETATLERRKAELKNIGTIGQYCIDKYYKQQKAGKLSEEDAKRMAMEEIKGMRYADGVGYLWINNTSRPFAKMLMHPTIPELDGTVLDAPRFNCAMGAKKNLFSASVDACLENGSGYVDYVTVHFRAASS